MTTCAHTSCSKSFPDVEERGGWDWFTGYFSEEVCWCYEHRDTRERQNAFAASRLSSSYGKRWHHGKVAEQ